MKKLFALMTIFIGLFTLAACGETVDEDQEAVDAAVSALILSGLDRVTTNITLPTSGRNETTISWSSSHPNVLSSSGEVERPEFGADNVVVTLTATVSRGDASAERTFEAVVFAFDEEIPDPITIAEMHDLAGGELGTIQGVITFVWGGSAYLQDDTGGFYIFRLANGFAPEAVVGNEILVTGRRDAFNGLRQFNVATIDLLQVVRENAPLPDPVLLTDFSTEALLAKQGMAVSLEGFYIVSLPDSIGTSGFNVTLEDTDGNTILMRVDSESNLGAERRDAVIEVINTLEAGQFVTITNAPMGWFNVAQIMVVDPEQITGGDLLDDALRTELAADRLEFENPDTIFEDLDLITAGAFETTITWSSSHPDYIAPNGTVTRDEIEDVEVTLTATITLNDAVFTKDFVLIVKDVSFVPATITVAEAIDAENGEMLYVEGIVTSKHGFNNIIFVQDEDGTAIMVGNVNSAASLRDAQVGDRVIVYGERSTFTNNGNNQNQIWRARLLEIVSSDNDVFVRDDLTIDEIIAQWPETSNQRFILNDVEVDFYDNHNHVFFVSSEDGEFQLKADVRNEAGFTPENRPEGTILVSVEFTAHQINFGDLQIVDLVVVEQNTEE